MPKNVGSNGAIRYHLGVIVVRPLKRHAALLELQQALLDRRQRVLIKCDLALEVVVHVLDVEGLIWRDEQRLGPRIVARQADLLELLQQTDLVEHGGRRAALHASERRG